MLPSTVSSESIASPPQPVAAPEPCRGCGGPLADDQRYCLECGERRAPSSSVLLSGTPQANAAAMQPPSPPVPGARSDRDGDGDGAGRSNAVTVIAGVGVLLLAMGVGVLIGRSGGSKQTAAAAPQVITVSTAPVSSTGAAAPEPATFSDDWPSGTSGYTVKLQTLPVAGTPASAVEAAKSAASAKGATRVGALKSEDFSGLKAGDYLIYAGVYHTRAAAQKAQSGLKRSFPEASVVRISSNAAKASSSASGSQSGGAGAGSSPSNPAPPSVVEKLKSGKGGSGGGKSYEEQSKKLPDVISTG
jgi:hypothetical protein